MDNSSRNIVKFIATITVAALLIMVARFYGQSQEKPVPPVADEVAKTETAPAEISHDPMAGTAEDGSESSDSQNAAEEIIEEDAELVMGEPSINLDQGAPVYGPPPQTEAAAIEQ